jgi:hypothetical protein
VSEENAFKAEGITYVLAGIEQAEVRTGWKEVRKMEGRQVMLGSADD